MCGIVGCLGDTGSSTADAVAVGASLLQHRGPDEGGHDTGARWCLGFRRLSILDLSTAGSQPMADPSGRYRLVFNGEVYNYVELRNQLEAEGERFVGGSDTEVVLRLLMLRGAAALPAFNGMFALAFVDTYERTFLLARDRFGVKPLYLRPEQGRLWFSSELKALLAAVPGPRRVDDSAVAEYLAMGYLSSDSCIVEGYRKLPPGHVLEGSLDRPEAGRERRYWQLDIEPRPGAVDLEQLEDLLEDAVRIRLRSDVPTGVFLSGGVDSGLVAVLAGRAARAAGGSTPTALTVGFDEEAYDESGLAAEAAAIAGLDHRIVPQRAAALDDVDRLAWFYDEPFADPSALATFALAEAASSVATVFLSGDGGDEAFAGYRRYLETLRRSALLDLPAPLARAARLVGRGLPATSALRFQVTKATAPGGRLAAAFDVTPEDPAVASVLSPRLRAHLAHAADPLWSRWEDAYRGGRGGVTAAQQRLDYALYLPDDILVKADRASMAHSIEVRSPFLDYRVAEYAATLPRDALLTSTSGKTPLRALARRVLPDSVSTGTKRGFAVPLDDWFRTTAGQAVVHERLLTPEAGGLGWWDTRAVRRVLDRHRSGRGRGFGELLWRLLMLEAWNRHFGAAATVVPSPPRSRAEVR